MREKKGCRTMPISRNNSVFYDKLFKHMTDWQLSLEGGLKKTKKWRRLVFPLDKS